MENGHKASTAVITEVLNGAGEAMRSIIPAAVAMGKPARIDGAFHHHDIGVIIGITGDLRGRMILDGSGDSFSKLGEKMFGMPITGEMVESFAGEVFNMISGHLGMAMAAKSIKIDITPPTIIVGDSKITGFQQAIEVPVTFEEAGDYRLVLSIDESTL